MKPTRFMTLSAHRIRLRASNGELTFCGVVSKALPQKGGNGHA
jgi:hypothetical protein